MIRETRNRDQIYHHGTRVNSDRPAKPAKPPKVVEIDADALAAAKADLDAKAAEPSRLKTGNDLPATGRCHTCDRAVSGERRYCGPCLARRGTS
jgi:hypothetical protein